MIKGKNGRYKTNLKGQSTRIARIRRGSYVAIPPE